MPAVPEPTREEIEAAVNASLMEPAAQAFIESATLLKFGITSQPLTYKSREKISGATRFFPSSSSHRSGALRLHTCTW
jgi:hypothetical protein